MTERDVAISRHAHEAKPRAARIRLAHALVNLLQRVAHVGEPVMPPSERIVQILARERLELAEHRVESIILNGIVALPRRRHRREADFPEPDLLGEMLEDREHVEVLLGERDARADRATAMP